MASRRLDAIAAGSGVKGGEMLATATLAALAIGFVLIALFGASSLKLRPSLPALTPQSLSAGLEMRGASPRMTDWRLTSDSSQPKYALDRL